MQNTKFSDKIAQAMNDFSFYVLGPIIKARGLNDNKVVDGIKVIDYDGFVDLTTEHLTVQSWLNFYLTRIREDSRMPLEVNGKSFETDEEGYLANLSDWQPDLAEAMAAADGAELEENHWK